MSFSRKMLFLSTGGLSRAAGIRTNSKKERIAKSNEKMLKLQRSQARATTHVSGAAPSVSRSAVYKSKFLLLDSERVTQTESDVRLGNERGDLVLTNLRLHFTPRGKQMGQQIWLRNVKTVLRLTDAPGFGVVGTTGGQSLFRTAPNVDWFDRVFTAANTPTIKLLRAAGSTPAVPQVPERVVANSPQFPNQPSIADELSKLAALRDRGILTDEEFGVQKSKLLS